MTSRDLELRKDGFLDGSEVSRPIDLHRQRNLGTEKPFESGDGGGKFRQCQAEVEVGFTGQASHIHCEDAEKTFSRFQLRLVRAHPAEDGFRNIHVPEGVASPVCLLARRFKVG